MFYTRKLFVVFFFLFFVFSVGYSQEQNINFRYKQFVKEWEKQIKLARWKIDTVSHQKKESVKIPETVFTVPFSIDSSMFVSIGISEPVADTMLAYNMAYNRAVAIAGLMAGVNGNALIDNYSKEFNTDNFPNESKFNRFLTFKSSGSCLVFYDSVQIVVHLSSGEIIVFLPFKKCNLKTNYLKNQPQAGLSVWETYVNDKQQMEHVFKLTLSGEIDSQSFQDNLYKKGKRFFEENTFNDDTIKTENIYYEYYPEQYHLQPGDSSLSYCSLQYGLWPAFLSDFYKQLKRDFDCKAKYTVSEMTDNYNDTTSLSIKRILETLNNIHYKIDAFDIKNNRLYLKLTSNEK